MKDFIRQQFTTWKGSEPDTVEPLPASGSHRRYYRITRNNESVLGVFNECIEENEAYFSFTEQFLQNGLPVPRLLHACPDRRMYFVEDLGDTTLFSLLPENRTRTEDFSPNGIAGLYTDVIENLVRFQTAGSKPGSTGGLDYRHVYPVCVFDRTAMLWDLNYFKYFFLKLSGIEFSEPALQADFDRLCDFLNAKPHLFFMYRDFQSRNIMIREDHPWFIDFQGGRKGPLAYDPASLLYDAKAGLPESFRDMLLEKYIRAASVIPGFDEAAFRKEFYACVLLRILQAMGTYGLRGFHEKKDLFLQSIPYAIRNLSCLRRENRFPLPLPEIERIIGQLEKSPWASFGKPGSENLTIRLYSFSFRKGYPNVSDEHGGGFVFDCRFLPNPGRLEPYKSLTGRNPAVRAFLDGYPEVSVFLQNCIELVRPAILNYSDRNFSSLSIAFGCTGGQHRSVYCAEKMEALLTRTFAVKTVLTHLEHPE